MRSLYEAILIKKLEWIKKYIEKYKKQQEKRQERQDKVMNKCIDKKGEEWCEKHLGKKFTKINNRLKTIHNKIISKSIRFMERQLKKWENLYQTSPFHLAINVSPHQFRMPDFVSHIQRVIEQTGINPNCLMLEVTEGVLIDNINDTVKKMHALKKLGVRFSIDDFGTGYSSLTYLKSLPLDQLK